MCGIAGFIDFTKKADEKLLRNMTDRLYYRGPDAAGYDFFQQPDCHIGLGHRRLSIIDLSPLGKQPMYTADGNLCIIFNGEVYNYAEIKKELVAKGYQFISGSDTEVILYSFTEWGVEAVNRFIGMFAFVIYDKRADEIFLFRDRAGVKPLYYYWNKNVFLFASELKAFSEYSGFEKEINPESVYNYLQYSYVPAPYSIFKNTWKLNPGHFLKIDLKTKEIVTKQYWNIIDFYKKEKLTITISEAQDELEKRLKKACDYRMVSDVPVGLFLSGGYDSSLVASMLQNGRTEKIKTFTIGFTESRFDEARYAKKVAEHLGTDHYETYCTTSEIQSIISELPDIYDEPIGAYSTLATVLLSRMAVKQVKVALSADGGDELFAGYERHRLSMRLNNFRAKRPDFINKAIGAIINLTPGILGKTLTRSEAMSNESKGKYADFLKKKISVVQFMDKVNQVLPEKDIDKIYTSAGRDLLTKEQRKGIGEITDSLSQMLCFDFLTYLPNEVLVKVDRATMCASLEGREPLLDHQLIEWVCTMPSSLKLVEGTSKKLFKQIVHKYIPQSLMDRPKMGFTLPMPLWFQNELSYLLDEVFNEMDIKQNGLFNYAAIEKEIRLFRSGNHRHFQLLWNLLVFQMWYKRNVE